MSADTFGTGSNKFEIVFVEVGNAGNVDDAGGGGGSYSSPYGGVSYNFRIAKYETSQDAIDRATALGLSNVTAGAWPPSYPAANINWFEAAEFVNWLNEQEGFHAAYDLTYSNGWNMSLWEVAEQASSGVGSGTNPYRHKDAFYFLPSESEWYKAAYHKNDGITANYWDFPTGANTVPDGIDTVGDQLFEAVFAQSLDQGRPNAVTNAGSSASAYGTYGQGGNVVDWCESAADGANTLTSETRVERAGAWFNPWWALSSAARGYSYPAFEAPGRGFRVASLSMPLVRIVRASTDTVTISWAPDLPGIVMEETSTLLPLGWTNSASGTNNPATVTVGSGTKLFRVTRH